MTPSAIFFGAIGTMIETSDLQRQAFNNAFAGAGLSWHWTMDDYIRLLERPGGHRRIKEFAEQRGEAVDVDAIYADKQKQFAILVQSAPLSPRPGVAEVLADARAQGIKTAFVTTTTQAQVDLVLNAVRPVVPDDAFDLITTGADVTRSKPAPDIYEHALNRLGVDAQHCIAIEDTPESAQAAMAAGVATFATPGRVAQGRRFPDGVVELDRLNLQALVVPHVTAAQ